MYDKILIYPCSRMKIISLVVFSPVMKQLFCHHYALVVRLKMGNLLKTATFSH